MHSTLAAAQNAYRAGNPEAALALLTPIATQPEALSLAGLCHLRQNNPAKALEILTDAHAQAPADPHIRLHLGIALQTLARHAEAIPHFRAAQPLLPDDPAPLLNLASSALVLGDIHEALRAARRARLRAPTLAQSHYVLGQALLAAARPREAAAAFTAATKRAPNFAEAWVNLAIARYRDGAIEPAKRHLRAALAIDPAHRAATASLAAFLRLTGGEDEAETMLRALLAKDPDADTVRLNLAAALLQENRDAEAETLLDRPDPADPNLRQHWLLQRALAAIHARRPDDARALLDRIGPAGPAIAPLLTWRRLLLADAAGDRAETDRQAQSMAEALRANETMVPEHRIIAHYDLARFWSRRGRLGDAVAHWTEGHRLLARFQPFSRDRFRQFADATIAQTGIAPLATNRDETPVFVVGMPRSGTTLVEQILAAHADVFGAGERPALEETFAALAGAVDGPAAPARIAALDTLALDAAAARYLARLHALAPEARRIVDKMPGNYRYLALAARMLPAARFIWCDRDPRDTGLSIFSLRFHGYHPYAHDLADLGWTIAEERRLRRHWQPLLGDRLLVLRLDDWIADFPATLARVTSFLGLPYDPACERFHTLRRRVLTASRNQVREPINARGIGRWRRYAPHLAPLIDALAHGGALDGERGTGS